jgi:Zn-dependent protease with chaperone function
MRGAALLISLVVSAMAMAGTPETPAAPLPIAPADESERLYLQKDYAFVNSAEIEAYLQAVMDKLLATREKQISRPHLILYSSPGFCAMADPTKNILISTETLRQLESEDELAALLGHELTHVLLGHSEKKSVLGRFPMNVETMGEIAATANQVKTGYDKGSNQQKTAVAGQATGFAKDSVRTSQNVSLFWSDLLMPNWNKGDEREADRVGYEMMRAAGYDPNAFATLFQKLHDAQVKRSVRMEQLRKSMIKRAQERELVPSGGDAMSTALHAAGEELRNMASEKVINTLFEDIDRISKNYDSPEERQNLLNQHAAKLPPLDGDKKPRSRLFAGTLRSGAGGGLLTADSAALSAVAAMEAGDWKLAGNALAPLLPAPISAQPTAATAPPAKKSKKTAGGGGPANVAALVKASASSAVTSGAPGPAFPVVPVSSPHLNFALGRWMLEQGHPEVAEGYARQWLASSRAPVRAFAMAAGCEAERSDFRGANATLTEGSRRLGSPVPFLAQQVVYAKSAADLPGAQSFTRSCHAEEEKLKSMLRKMLDVVRDSPPTGLYAECLVRLGSPLPDEESKMKRVLAAPFRRGAKTVEGLVDGKD